MQTLDDIPEPQGQSGKRSVIGGKVLVVTKGLLEMYTGNMAYKGVHFIAVEVVPLDVTLTDCYVF
jgi:hypothetical protein